VANSPRVPLTAEQRATIVEQTRRLWNGGAR
jgi:hypothetical protein